MSVSIKKTGVIGVGGGTINYVEKTATGDIASFSDGANNIPCPSVLCSINPVQDLHGQDYPYPSGGGKNKVNIADITVTSQSFYAIGVLNSGTYTFSFNIKNNTSIDGTVRVYRYQGSDLGSYSIIANDNKRASITFTLTEETDVRFSVSGRSSGYNYNLTNFQLELGSTATPYAPYSNICPITGHTELNLVHTGKNLWDEEWENGYYNRTTGAKAGNTDTSYYRSKNFIPCLPNTTYYFVPPLVHASNYTWLGVLYYDANKVYLSSINTTTALKTTPANARYMTFYIEVGTSGSTYNNDISINYPSTDTSYHAYTGSTTTTDFGTTVYGGTLEGVSGVVWLTVDRAIVDLGSLFYTYYEYGSISGGYSNTLENVIKKPTSGSAMSDSISDKLVQYSDNQFESSPDNTFAINTYGRIKIHKSGITNATELKNALSGYMLVYPLATPTTTQLTPQEVKSLLGSNNIYHDCNGDIEVVYRTSSSTIPGTFIEDNQHKTRIGKEFINSEDFIEI